MHDHHHDGQRQPAPELLALPTTLTAGTTTAKATYDSLAARPMTSSERGRVFRERQRQRARDLETQVKHMRREIKLLHNKLLLVRTKRTEKPQEQQQHVPMYLHLPPPPSAQQPLLATATVASCVALVRELFAVLRYGLDALDTSPSDRHATTAEQLEGARPEADRHLATRYKVGFLWRVLNPAVRFGDLVGVEAAIEQWRRHTAAYATFKMELQSITTVAVASAQREELALAVRSTLHVRFSRVSFSSMFPGALELRPELAAPLLNRDLTIDCSTHVQFTDIGQVKMYAQEIDLVKPLVAALGTVHKVTELLQFSVMTQYGTLESQSERDLLGVRSVCGGTALRVHKARGKQATPAHRGDQEDKEAIAKRVLADFRALR